ncbi:MAG: acyl-CoA/acyl-ACP dehydrogenase [Phycisphaeraceae bacterium]|nr:acyl-CoA/acyl-ACP dehydrogenase [Phycisphaeraceae bacterium]
MITVDSDCWGHRASFEAACLEVSPPAALSWIKTLKHVVSDQVLPHAVKVDHTASYPVDAIAALRKIGAFGVTVSSKYGGHGFGDAIAALTVEIVAAACPSTAAVMMFHYQVVRRVEKSCSPSLRADDLQKLARVNWIGSSAWTEFGAGADKSHLTTSMKTQDGVSRITGAKHFCTGLEGASLIHVLLDASPNDDVAQTFVRVLVESPGVDCSEIYPLLGLRGSSTGTVTLTNVVVDENSIIGKVGQAGEMMKANHTFFMNPGLIAMGVAHAAFVEAANGALGMSPGARDISGYQASRFRLVEMEASLSKLYALSTDAIHKNQGNATDYLKVKLVASETAVKVAEGALRMAGGRGFHADWPYERHLRDAYATILMGPANEIIKERSAEDILSGIVAYSQANNKLTERAS